ncbi:hypothetical protein Tco_1056244 [Tanacetum coccineum]|uniref:Uncharacterized protein n=1 Tax=Tanacetum coccineum TaxID=301880 RepID=A0ABQ5H1Y5_9ASTR
MNTMLTYKGFNIITELLKEIKNAVKDDPVIYKKISEATEPFTKISTNKTEVLSLVKGFNFSDLQSSMNALLAHALKQDEELAAWAKSSTNMAWNLGSRILGLERAQNHIQSSMSSLKEDTHSIKTMMTKMKEKSEEPKHSIDANIELIGSSKPQPSITQAQPITIINPEPIISQREGKGIAIDEQVEDQRKLVKASSIIRPDPDALIPYTINEEVYYLTAEQLQAYIDKEEEIKKAGEEARLFAISKHEVIKVVQEEVKKLGIHPKEAITTKAGKKFKKAQDAEHEVLKRQHTEKVKKSIELRKHKFDNYMWTINSRLKPETITNIKIHPKTKPVVITVFRVVQDLMNLLSQRKKRKHMELEPEIKIPGLECNQALPENVLFVNNMVIKEPEHGIFFTDEFGDQAFQRWSDIDKVGMEALVSYLVAASMVQSPKNARFSMKLKKLITEHPDQEKLKSKKVKLEALGYEMD